MLEEYKEKRNFKLTTEPAVSEGGASMIAADEPLRYVIQKHAARRLHYDFRLEIDGVLVSWAIPKGPSVNPRDRRMARRTEDHPLEYEKFEGVIPDGEDGAGPVIVWDHGTYDNRTEHEMTTCLGRG